MQLHDIGARVDGRRMDLRITWGTVAKRAGINRRTLFNYMRDGFGSATLDRMRELARALDVSVGWMIGESSAPGSTVCRPRLAQRAPSNA